mmetsp:Transcript_36806/g.60927  ORF Transcript_36806/g.60927 Transcript_36806/m.60927 type:complete len:573 (+) Transcript_36806:54-1772(+)|eukprot:CAMPEP_0119329180 /NCGR_PEP_ID=MMETSP1333-20130426/75281_1 /TAXON_ID=418940 /ORGANISM="Scyphosphaera apsteinii, Strain RCC1455" /LENGTH=572 /DNA_ID=CAMNT_0007338239 /DNA_START=54 /DNA_END=1772 /DNA_ORIENTATION=+
MSCKGTTVLHAWIRFWVLQQCLMLYAAGISLPINAVQVLLLGALGAFPSTPLACVSLCVRLSATLHKMPFVWDSYYWCLQTDLVLLLALLPALARRCSANTALFTASRTIRVQLALFYLGAGFWKINTSFIHPRYSCAPIFFLQLLASYTPLWLEPPAATLQLVAHAAPGMTIAGELAIGVLLLSSGAMARLGVCIALLLHFGIALTPPPNDAVSFSVASVTRLLLTIPTGTSFVHTELVALVMPSATPRSTSTSSSPHRLRGTLPAAAAVVCGSVAARMVLERVRSHPRMSNASLNPSVAYFGALVVLTVRAVIADGGPQRRERIAERGSFYNAYVHLGFISLAFAYSFVFIILGVQDLGAPNMYSNLRMHAGSNHFFMSTSFLQHRLAATTGSAFSGGVVRIESTDSLWFRQLYPAELTSDFTARERRFMKTAGHSARMFNGGKARVLGINSIPPPAAMPLARYSLHALELRRLLGEARQRNEKFNLRYTRLAGSNGNESWRINGSGSVVDLEEDGNGGRRCHVDGKECTADEIPLLPAPSYWELKLVLGQPYPILTPEDGQSELHCFGP